MDLIFSSYNSLLELFSKHCLTIEISLGLFVLWVILKKSDNGIKDYPKELNKMLENWEPKPLVDKSNIKKHKGQSRFVDNKIGKYIHVNGKKCLNLSSFNFLGYLENDTVKESAIRAVKKYGIGSCGPRGFYGTVDIHLQLEEEIAKFLEVEEAIVYSYGFSAIASAIPAYAKRSDVVFVDENVNFAIQKGLDASRSVIIYFEHNNVEHLKKLLEKYTAREAKNKKKSKRTKKFLIVEGIYNKSGDICPLIDLMEIKKNYKLRLFIDESISFGTLGKHGRGVTEHFNIPVKDVDLIMGSMEHALASVGGFSAGSSFVVEHQRLSGLGYCFSASLPPLLTVAAITNLNGLQKNPSLVEHLNKLCNQFHCLLNSNETITDNFIVKGDPISPIKHLVSKYISSERILNFFVNYCEDKGLALCIATYLEEDKTPCEREPSIRLSVTSSLDEDDIKFAVQTIQDGMNLLLISLGKVKL